MKEFSYRPQPPFRQFKKTHLVSPQKDFLGWEQVLHLWGWSTFFITGGAALIIILYFSLKDLRSSDPNYNIRILEQTGPQKEALTTSYLAEVMELSVDHPCNIYQFNLETAKNKLLATSFIKKVKLTKKLPNKLYIDYTVRSPLAYIHDYTNTAIDEGGFLFPISPFFTPKNLPQIYLGNGLSYYLPKPWGTQLSPEEIPHIKLALNMLATLKSPKYRDFLKVRYIDLSAAFIENYGNKQIILILEDQIVKEFDEVPVLYVFPRILRLSTKNYLEELRHYLVLRKFLLAQAEEELEKDAEWAKEQAVIEAKTMIVDLRLPQLAFIKEVATIDDSSQ